MKLREHYPLYLANRAYTPNTDLPVVDKFTGEIATRVPLASSADIETAIQAAVNAAERMRKLPSYRRADVLHHCVKRFQERYEELAFSLCVEAGKPIRDARGEVTRLIDTFRIAAEEAVRNGGEWYPLDISQRAEGYEAIVKRVPWGPCSFITPFNFPLNLAAHKIAPAIAVGAPFVVKPSSLTPIGAILIGEILAETDLPEGAFSILPCKRDAAAPFSEDDRFKHLSFTGSPEVGWELKARAGKKTVTLELGGNAGCIVAPGTDLDFATERITFGAFYQSGQSCISVQRLFIHESLYEELKARLVAKANSLVVGDPKLETTFLGPIISETEAQRVEQWVQRAVKSGAKLLCGGTRNGAMMPATWLENVPESCEVSCREVFGPVAIMQPYSDFKEAIAAINRSDFGLQAGVFTPNLRDAWYAWDELEVGGVVINDIPSMRVDNMPYGGTKDSGIGREGVRYAMTELTQPRLMVVKR